MNEVVNEIMKLIEPVKNKTTFEILDSCIEKVKSPAGKDFFIKLKIAIEEDLKTYAATHNVSSEIIMNNHIVVKKENGFEIRNMSGQKIILKIYLLSEYIPNAVIIERFP